MGKKRKRKCKCCGATVEAWNLFLCDACQAAGFTVKRQEEEEKEAETAELMKILKERERCHLPLLKGMTIEEVAAAARAWNAAGYTNYGKFRGWCESMGTLPPKK